MATIKSFTDIEQSTKLAEILPIESADAYWWYSGKRYYVEAIDDGDFNENTDIRAWSLAALLSLIKDKCGYFEFVYLKRTYDGRANPLEDVYRLSTDVYDVYNENGVDACYAMILKLNELKML